MRNILLPAQPSSLIPTESVALLIDTGCESQSTDECDIAQLQEITTHIESCKLTNSMTITG